MPIVNKGDSKVYLAGDHTDIKALMQNFPEYKKNFMRIDQLNYQIYFNFLI